MSAPEASGGARCGTSTSRANLVPLPSPVIGFDRREPLDAVERGGFDEEVRGAEVQSVPWHVGPERHLVDDPPIRRAAVVGAVEVGYEVRLVFPLGRERIRPPRPPQPCRHLLTVGPHNPGVARIPYGRPRKYYGVTPTS